MFGQEIPYSMSDFYLNGSATFRDDTTIMITDNLLEQTGSMWYKDDIDLNEPFHIELEIFFGCSDGGADGITFILHPEWSTGSTGEGMGVGGLNPSFGVEMDTYQNFHLADAHFDHVALMANGASHHKLGLTEPIPLHPNKGNVENCTFYNVKFDWNPASQIFTFEFNGVVRIRREIDLVNLIFDGNSNVFWGFGSATGLRRNKHLVKIKKLEFTPNETLTDEDREALAAGEVYTLPELEFEAGSADLPYSARPTLDKLMRFHQDFPDHTIILNSFTDSSGEESSNLRISTQRAEAIANYMISKGFAKEKLIYYGNGEVNPIDDNETEQGRKNNRRVEVIMKVIKV
ncbi:hypothetical protein GCM10007940_15470 [Portibacter lacus]|uniref:OmpA-like domain-containing protein n=2 Tax=Portibacter lacus TaxID=1099794 RepID=A0AA37WEA3_9BACT|nr:hypothetical protein GCM10007940_15470 [Portibacter lacus]